MPLALGKYHLTYRCTSGLWPWFIILKCSAAVRTEYGFSWCSWHNCDIEFSLSLQCSLYCAVSFGVREEDSDDDCIPEQNKTAVIVPGESVTLRVNTCSPIPAPGQEYCFIAHELDTGIEGGKYIMCVQFMSSYFH